MGFGVDRVRTNIRPWALGEEIEEYECEEEEEEEERFLVGLLVLFMLGLGLGLAKRLLS